VNARLFAAADLPPHVRESLVSWTHDAVGDDRAMRLVGPHALHVTLCFLGWREVDDVPRLSDLVLGCAAPARGLSVGRVLWLAPGRPHVLTVGLDDADGELAVLHRRVQDALVTGAGYMPEGREFLPHVTVGRVRRGSRPLRRGLPPLPTLEPFACPSLTLYRSQLHPAGARYEALARVDLPVA
jgi:2'-5' RNA ligase